MRQERDETLRGSHAKIFPIVDSTMPIMGENDAFDKIKCGNKSVYRGVGG